MTNSAQNGTLYIVATPIGNLGDITYRAVEILRQVDLIVVEDSRHSAKLFQHYNITSPAYVLHDHNEKENSIKLVEKLQQGVDLALISDAGTPLISDPGYWLVNLAIQHSIPVAPIPGPSASISALSVSGLPSDRFCFEGFLPAKTQARKNRLQELASETRTLIFYEAPHRILDSLRDLTVIFGPGRPAVITRELTKTYETVLRAPLAEILDIVERDANQQKGEFVILVHGAETRLVGDEEQVRLLGILLEAMPVKTAASIASKITGIKKNQLYERALELKGAR
ncbi:MAG: 16S rRNA (cytidine(1402)-2'-O)-methyltransferase [Gammaproteobacteria bacterium]|nr:16S rRNA (cytidine(1402)-2'-O)-methyltransferase [Gammaproteobacteria bacterium]